MTQPAGEVRSGVHWHAAGASVRGASHDKHGVPCQDAHAWREMPGGTLVLAVADGAGSASLSQIGSARAALSAVEWVIELLGERIPTEESDWQELLLAALQTAHESVLAAAKKRNVPVRDMATTLILQIATPDVTAAVQVGDGAAVALTEAGDVVAVTSPQRGEYANETVFFTSPNYMDVVQFGYCNGPINGVGALSDGLQGLAIRMQDGVPHPGFFNPFFCMVAEKEDIRDSQEYLHKLLRSERIQMRADDDLTLVIASLHRPQE